MPDPVGKAPDPQAVRESTALEGNGDSGLAGHEWPGSSADSGAESRGRVRARLYSHERRPPDEVKLRPWEDIGRAEDDRAPDSAYEADSERDVVMHSSRVLLAIGALGVVYGDIGTSPLYTMQVTLTYHAAKQISAATMYGIASLIFWAITIIVSVKYAWVIMRVHNRGDGGIMALASLCRRRKVPRVALMVTLGIFGASLFFGDGFITPAISVLSAVGGLTVAAPGVAHLVVPISAAILVALFLIQRRGAGTVGKLFGPVMLVWFAVIALLGLHEVLLHPGVLQALSPSYGVEFFLNHGAEAYLALGGIVLCVTGAEALYADRGHFGPAPIRMAWFWVVVPGVILSYLGQAALVIAHPGDRDNPFFRLVPAWGQIPMVILATVATIIASQAVISGSFSVARQAMQLGYLPRLRIRHTSKMEGQIYVPFINWMLAVGVIGLVFAFRSSTALSNAYGVAVTGTFTLNTLLFVVVARNQWQDKRGRVMALGALFLTVEGAFFTSNLTKIVQGAWFPLAVGLLISTVMLVWNRGRAIVTANRQEAEGDLPEFLEGLCDLDPPMRRIPGVGIFLNPGARTTPLGLRAMIEHSHALHETVLIVSLEEVSVPDVDEGHRFVIKRIGPPELRLRYVLIRVGYQETRDVPQRLRDARRELLLERDLDLEHATYFVSRINLVEDEESPLPRWQQKLFVGIARNAGSATEAFRLPLERTISIGSQIPA